jgi:predicted outer membrane repeat protein
MKTRTRAFHPVIRLTLVCLLLFGLLAVSPAQPAQATVYTVTNTNDSGTGSLRWAIASAGDGDTVTFSGALSGQTISLSSQIEIEDDLTIDGSNLAYPVAVIASSSVRIFLVDSLATATINQLVLGNSYGSGAGGGIIITHGDLTITNSTLAGGETPWYGGAIYNTGSLTVSGSTIFGNLADGYGGAIYNDGTLELYNSTIYDNSGEYGGGLYTNLAANSTVVHSTFAENTATYGGSAVHTAGSLTLYNSLLSGNTGGSAECAWTGSMTASTNLISDGSCAATYTTAFLGPLADNGGPTETMSIGYLSAARNTGNGLYCESTDQRGVARDGACDIGAYEYATSLTVDSTNDPGDGVCDVVECTLRDAVATIESNGVIDFDPSLAGDTITLGSEIQIAGGLIIDGSALSPAVQVSGGDSTRVFHLLSTADVELYGLDIIEGGV